MTPDQEYLLSQPHIPAIKSASPDRNVENVRSKMLQRSVVGLKKYNITTERTDLSKLQWLIHAQEEAMDMAIYLEKLIQLELNQEESNAPQRPANSTA